MILARELNGTMIGRNVQLRWELGELEGPLEHVTHFRTLTSVGVKFAPGKIMTLDLKPEEEVTVN